MALQPVVIWKHFSDSYIAWTCTGNFLFPMVLQNKFDVYHTGKQLDHIGEDVRALCRQHDIKLIGYSPLSSFPFVMVPLADPIVETIAAKRQVPPAEVSDT